MPLWDSIYLVNKFKKKLTLFVDLKGVTLKTKLNNIFSKNYGFKSVYEKWIKYFKQRGLTWWNLSRPIKYIIHVRICSTIHNIFFIIYYNYKFVFFTIYFNIFYYI